MVAFSGGPDSLGLLCGLRPIAESLELRITAAHLDHALDTGSADRAEQARRLAASLEVDFRCERSAVPATLVRRHGSEAAARVWRYRWLERQRRCVGARWILTGHHRDDQIETLLLRLLFGSGLDGLGGIRKQQGQVLRPLLDLPRRELAAETERWDLVAVSDPTNRDERVPRNRIRQRLRPRLETRFPDLDRRLVALADVSTRTRDALDRRLEPWVETTAGVDALVLGCLPRVERQRLESLPEEVADCLLRLLHRRAGAAYPPPLRARDELRRQLATDRRVGCDCGGGWRWDETGRWITLWNKRPPIGVFTYTCPVPGSVRLPELSLVLRLRRRTEAAVSSSRSDGSVALHLEPGTRSVSVRGLRPGDRFRCPESGQTRSLRSLLMGRGIPPAGHGRLPIVEAGGRVAWVPGLGVAASFAPRVGEPNWTLRLTADTPSLEDPGEIDEAKD